MKRATRNTAKFARQLTDWFRAAHRDLPWRDFVGELDPYRVLVSEIMLQQTTVAMVKPKYEVFLRRFPTVPALAAAPIEDVLALWAGLGYYQRARNLHACAQAIMRDHAGKFPRALNDVLTLPGVGRYTAGAVTSLAFDAPSPIVDANITRVLARVFCIEGDIKGTANQQRLWQEAEHLVEAAARINTATCRPSTLNSALMELGALVCTPRDPDCPRCPVAALCAARAAGLQNELPQLPAKTTKVEMHDACGFAPRTVGGVEQVLVRQRPHEAKVWWRGMWELPRTTILPGETPADALQRLFADEHGVAIEVGARLRTVRHGVTHHQITLDCYAVRAIGEPRHAAWRPWAELEAVPMPSVMRRLVHWLHTHPREDQLELL